jgi:hypothetical protein
MPRDGPEPGGTGARDTKTTVLDHLVDGATAISIVTFVAYAIVFGFEEGFNAFFQIPADYVAPSFLSVFHVLSLIVFTIVHDPGLAALEAIALVILLFVPAFVYATRVWWLALTTFVLYCASNVLKPVVLLAAAIIVCFALSRTAGAEAATRPRLVARIGDKIAKSAFIFMLLLTPLFYFGFRFAETENPRLVFNDKDTRWIVARILNGEFIMIRLLPPGGSVPDCVDQYPNRASHLSRDLRIIKEDVQSGITSRPFDEPMGYCIFKSEALSLGNSALSSFIFVRQGPAPASYPTPPARATGRASR